MFEWMPVLCGAVLGLLHRRAYIGQRTLLCLIVLIACAATAISGELFDEPWLILVDLALTVTGLIASRLLAAYPNTQRSLRSASASHEHTTLPVRSPHLRNTRSRMPARQKHPDEAL